jgi:hypothetical protein
LAGGSGKVASGEAAPEASTLNTLIKPATLER